MRRNPLGGGGVRMDRVDASKQDSGGSSVEEFLLDQYLHLRASIGYLGFALPFVLALGAIALEGPGIRSSISDYYYSGMRNVFVGILCAIGVFLFSYKGYTKWQDRICNIAAFCIVGVALFPTTPEIGATAGQQVIGVLHLCFAAGFFSAIAYFCLKIFTQNTPGRSMTKNKARNNSVYVWCGWTIVGSIVLIALVNGLPKTMTAWARGLDPVFWLESTAVVAFGVSWMTKGGVLSALVRAGASFSRAKVERVESGA